MARNENDRNQRVIDKARNKKLDYFPLASGVNIQLKDIDPVFVQAAIRSVTIPDVPTYKTKTVSGREETFPVDEVVVEQTPELKPVWEKYLREKQMAELAIADITTRALFLEGTVVQEEIADTRWYKRLKMVGVPVPADPEERWMLYLQTALSAEETLRLSSAIMRRTGVPEEMVAAAEESFRSDVRTDEEPGRLADAGADQGTITEGQVAAQPTI